MSRIVYTSFLGLVLVLLSASDIIAQWRQLPVPSVHGRIASAVDGSLWVLTNGTLCHSDTGKNNWTYQPFPYDLNNQDYGLSNADPPRQLIVCSADTLLFISYYGELFSIVRGEPSLHFAMEGLRSKKRLNPGPFLFTSRGRNDEILLCHDDLYASTNNGVLWESKYRYLKEGYSFGPGAVDEQNQDVMFLHETMWATNIYKSTDSGVTWRQVHHDSRWSRPEDMLVCPGGQIYAGEYFSNDTGKTWTTYSMDPNNIYFANGNVKYIYNQQEHGIFANNRAHGIFFRDLDDPTFRRTALSSSTWTERARSGVDLTYEQRSGTMYAIINDSLYEYHQGMARPLTRDIHAPVITALLSYNADGDTLLLATPHSTLKSTDGGTTWIETAMWGASLDRKVFTYSKSTKSLMFEYTLPHPLNTWIYENEKLSSKVIREFPSSRLTYDPFSTDTFYGGINRVWRMTDSIVLHADTNAILYGDNFENSLPIQELRCIAFDARRNGVMLIGGLDRGDQPFLYMTTDLGNQWERIESIPLKQPPIEMIFDPDAQSRILIFDPAGVYISADYAATWEYRDPGLGVRKATCVAVDPDNAANIFLGVASPSRTEAIPPTSDGGGGVWRSSDGGQTWGKLSIEGLNNYNVSHVLVLRNPKRILVGTPCGAYEYILDTTSSIHSHEKRNAAHFRLRVYPNPSRGTASVTYVLDHPSSVRLVVHDILGRIVFSQSSDVSTTGEQRYTLDTAGMKSGFYFITLETPTGIESRSMFVIQ